MKSKQRRGRELASLLTEAARVVRSIHSLFSVMPDFEAQGSRVRCNWSSELQVNLDVIAAAMGLCEERMRSGEYSTADYSHFRSTLVSMQRVVIYAA